MRWRSLFVLLCALAAHAHDADVIAVTVQHGLQPDLLVETVRLTSATLAFLAPLDADADELLSQADLDAKNKALRAGFWNEAPLLAGGRPCELQETKAFLRDGFVELQAELRCAQGALRQDFRILRVLPANYRVVLQSRLKGEVFGQAFAQGSLTTLDVPRCPRPGSCEAATFREAFDGGLQNGLSLEVLGGLWAVLVSVGAWRRGLVTLGLVLGGVMLGSFVRVGFWPPTIFVVLVATAAAVTTPPSVVAALLGLAVGARVGGGPLVEGLGLGLGMAMVLLVASPAAISAGVLLQRRPQALRVARWIPLALATISVLGHARLSW